MPRPDLNSDRSPFRLFPLRQIRREASPGHGNMKRSAKQGAGSFLQHACGWGERAGKQAPQEVNFEPIQKKRCHCGTILQIGSRGFPTPIPVKFSVVDEPSEIDLLQTSMSPKSRFSMPGNCSGQGSVGTSMSPPRLPSEV